MEFSTDSSGLLTVLINGSAVTGCANESVTFCPGGTLCYTGAPWQTHSSDGMCACSTMVGNTGVNCDEWAPWSQAFVATDLLVLILSAMFGTYALYLLFRLQQQGLLTKKMDARETTLVFAILAEIFLVVFAILQVFVQLLPVDGTEVYQGAQVKSSLLSLYFITGITTTSADTILSLAFLFVTVSNLNITLVVWGIANAALKYSNKIVTGITYFRKFLFVFYAAFFPVFVVLIALKKSSSTIYPAFVAFLIVNGVAVAGAVRIRQLIATNKESKNIKQLWQVAHNCDQLSLSMGLVLLTIIVSIALGSPINNSPTFAMRQIFIHLIYVAITVNEAIVVRYLGKIILHIPGSSKPMTSTPSTVKHLTHAQNVAASTASVEP